MRNFPLATLIMGDVIDGHKAIYDALLNKDAVGAFEAANKHAFEAMDRVTHQIGKKINKLFFSALCAQRVCKRFGKTKKRRTI